MGGGAFRDVREACRATVSVVKETVPNRPAQKHYNRAFPVYQRLYRSLKDDFRSIAELEK